MESENKKKYVWILLAAIAIFGFSYSFPVHAANSQVQINAELLSNIWYSTNTVNENDGIMIYAGFQNHSSNSLFGTAGFFVDGLQIGKEDFTASSKSLIKLETKYTAIRGSHTVQVKILNIKNDGQNTMDAFPIENLLAYESEKKNLSVNYKITADEILKNAKNVSNNVVKSIDTQTEKLALYLDGLKNPAYASSSDLVAIIKDAPAKIAGKVLGVSTENTDKIKADNQKAESNKSFSLYNSFIALIAYIIRHWIWTLAVIVAGVLYISFR